MQKIIIYTLARYAVLIITMLAAATAAILFTTLSAFFILSLSTINIESIFDFSTTTENEELYIVFVDMFEISVVSLFVVMLKIILFILLMVSY